MLLQELQAEPGGVVAAGAEGHTRIQGDDDLFGLLLILLPGRVDHQTVAQLLGVIVLLPGGGPLLLLYRSGGDGVGNAGGGVLLPQEGDGLGGVVVRADVDVDQCLGHILFQQLLIDQVDVSDFRRLGAQIGIILDVNAIGHHHLCNGCCLVHLSSGNFDIDFSPVHNEPPSLQNFYKNYR